MFHISPLKIIIIYYFLRDLNIIFVNNFSSDFARQIFNFLSKVSVEPLFPFISDILQGIQKTAFFDSLWENKCAKFRLQMLGESGILLRLHFMKLSVKSWSTLCDIVITESLEWHFAPLNHGYSNFIHKKKLNNISNTPTGTPLKIFKVIYFVYTIVFLYIIL